MRTIEFKMERKELLDTVREGEIFSITEFELPGSWYYVLGRAYAMSANYNARERILADKGRVLEVRDTPKGYFVTVEVDK